MNNKVAVTLQRWEIAEEGNRIGSELNSEKMIFFSLQNNQYSIHVNQSKKWVSILLWVSLATIAREHQRRKSKDRTFVCFVVLLQSDCWFSYVYGPHFFLSFWNFLSFNKISFAVERYEISLFFFPPYCTSKVSLSLVSKFNPPELPNCIFSLLAILGLVVSRCYDLWLMRHALVSFISYSLSFKSIISHYSYVLCGFQQLIIAYQLMSCRLKFSPKKINDKRNAMWVSTANNSLLVNNKRNAMSWQQIINAKLFLF